ANVLIDQGDLENALKELKICVKLEPSNAWVHNNLGVLYQRRNYLEEAEEQFLRAITLEPANRAFERNLELLREHKQTKSVQADAADLI
ncbi:MAG: tetratricopeptide repeat protein, partial [Candidatus Obscuribacterales bacterium]|nr:tetratricopeptide repeat protein [Candidatus Obscuribacterales bacterium]